MADLILLLFLICILCSGGGGSSRSNVHFREYPPKGPRPDGHPPGMCPGGGAEYQAWKRARHED